MVNRRGVIRKARDSSDEDKSYKSVTLAAKANYGEGSEHTCRKYIRLACSGIKANHLGFKWVYAPVATAEAQIEEERPSPGAGPVAPAQQFDIPPVNFEEALDSWFYSFVSSFVSATGTLETFIAQWKDAACANKLHKQNRFFNVSENGDCLYTCMFCDAFMCSRGTSFLEKEEKIRLFTFSTFGARILKKMFKTWLVANRNTCFSGGTLPVDTLLKDQVQGWTWDGIMTSYESTNFYGGETEILVLAHLAPGFRVSIQQKGGQDTEVNLGTNDDVVHTLFLRRENIHSASGVHYSIRLWDVQH